MMLHLPARRIFACTELIDPLIAAHKGHIVKTTGDGLLLSFPSVVEAVIEFRIGINIGDVIVERTYSAMASTSRHDWSRLRRQVASACLRMRTGRYGASSKFPSP